MKELARVVGAVAEARTVEAGMTRLVELLGRVAFHEQVDGHDTCAQDRRGGGGREGGEVGGEEEGRDTLSSH